MHPLVLMAAFAVCIVLVLLAIALLRWRRTGISESTLQALPAPRVGAREGVAYKPPQAISLSSNIEAEARAAVCQILCKSAGPGYLVSIRMF
jgi:hypothetical protein